MAVRFGLLCSVIGKVLPPVQAQVRAPGAITGITSTDNGKVTTTERRMRQRCSTTSTKPHLSSGRFLGRFGFRGLSSTPKTAQLNPGVEVSLRRMCAIV
ncbi:hypothetical protein EDB87DRAFT_140771 [Lactarius vividus]|nr:hypothetical protein EDB87DRAFT_140771 [Lactarius vividus]